MQEIRVHPRWNALVDDDDFERLSSYRWQGERDSKTGRVYAVAYLWSAGKCQRMKMHRMVMNARSGEEVDHRKTGETLNNQTCNLRMATRSGNNANRMLFKNNTSGFKGVGFDAKAKVNKWRVSIRKDGILRHLGAFSTIELAAEAYARAARELHGEFANLGRKDVA